jgi:hypothetical protein
MLLSGKLRGEDYLSLRERNVCIYAFTKQMGKLDINKEIITNLETTVIRLFSLPSVLFSPTVPSNIYLSFCPTYHSLFI